MNMDLRGGTAIVTGASKGIGRAIAEALAREGMRLVLGARSPGPLQEAARAIGGEVETVAGDIGDEATAARLVEAAGRFGRLDVVVNNAGIGHQGRLEDMDPAEFDRVYR